MLGQPCDVMNNIVACESAGYLQQFPLWEGLLVNATNKTLQ